MEKWKIEQAEKAAKEKKEKEEAEKEIRNKMRERLLASGVPEAQIAVILAGKTVGPHPHPHPHQGHAGAHMMQGHHHMPGQIPVPPPVQMPPYGMEVATTKTTYTRMARKHLSIEALRARAIEYDIDTVCLVKSLLLLSSLKPPLAFNER